MQSGHQKRLQKCVLLLPRLILQLPSAIWTSKTLAKICIIASAAAFSFKMLSIDTQTVRKSAATLYVAVLFRLKCLALPIFRSQCLAVALPWARATARAKARKSQEGCKDAARRLQGGCTEAARKLQGSYKEAARLPQGGCKDVARMLQG